MDARDLLQDLLQHMEWADATVFAAVTAAAGQDSALLARLRHLHLVQKVFLDVWRERSIDPHETDGFDLAALASFARGLHPRLQASLAGWADAELDRPVRLPWAAQVSAALGFAIEAPSLGQTLLQVTAHSAYHRGQINARLRELGLAPPMTDFIAWVWARKPAPPWPAGGPGPAVP